MIQHYLQKVIHILREQHMGHSLGMPSVAWRKCGPVVFDRRCAVMNHIYITTYTKAHPLCMNIAASIKSSANQLAHTLDVFPLMGTT